MTRSRDGRRLRTEGGESCVPKKEGFPGERSKGERSRGESPRQ